MFKKCFMNNYYGFSHTKSLSLWHEQVFSPTMKTIESCCVNTQFCFFKFQKCSMNASLRRRIDENARHVLHEHSCLYMLEMPRKWRTTCSKEFDTQLQNKRRRQRRRCFAQCLNGNLRIALSNCGDTPNLIGTARASNVYFINAEVAETASRCLAELMGGVMDVSKSLKAETSSAAPVQSAGATFFIGDSDAQEQQETSADDPAANASACTILRWKKSQHPKMMVWVSLLMTSAPHRMTPLRLQNRTESLWAVPQHPTRRVRVLVRQPQLPMLHLLHL